MKLLLVISALMEVAVGTLLLILPGITVSLLLGVPLDTPAGMVASRLAGAALLTVGLACWNLRSGQDAVGIVSAMLVYNFAAVVVLGWAGIRLELATPMLWPVIVLHFALGLWCLLAVWFSQRRSARETSQE